MVALVCDSDFALLPCPTKALVPRAAVVHGPGPRTHELLGIFERLVESFLRLELLVPPRVEDDPTTIPSNFGCQLSFIYVYPAEVTLLNFTVIVPSR